MLGQRVSLLDRGGSGKGTLRSTQAQSKNHVPSSVLGRGCRLVKLRDGDGHGHGGDCGDGGGNGRRRVKCSQLILAADDDDDDDNNHHHHDHDQLVSPSVISREREGAAADRPVVLTCNAGECPEGPLGVFRACSSVQGSGAG